MIKKVLVYFFILAATFSSFTTARVFAQTEIEDLCNPSKNIFDKIQSAFDLDVRRTVMNMTTSVITDAGMHMATNSEPEEVVGCLGYLNSQTGGALSDIPGIEACDSDANYCEGLINTYEDAQPEGDGMLQLRNSRVSGSFIGMAHMLENATYEPLPANLAYYINDQTKDIPFMGKAFAQNITYSGPFLEITYDLWKVFRNASYGALAIVMIIVGIMIMTRKKLNPQTAVTVQYAVPKMVIALILITFSYAIGASIASFAYALKFSVDNLIITIASGSNPSGLFLAAVELAELGIVGNLLMMYALGLAGGPFGVVNFLILTIGFLVAIVIWVVTLIKMLMIYIKMIIAIITAPARFLYGAIPGKDEETVKWFKEMATYTLSIFAMGAIIGITRIVAAAVLFQMLDNVVTFTAALIVVGPLLVAFIYIFGFNQARKAPEQLEVLILNKKPSR